MDPRRARALLTAGVSLVKTCLVLDDALVDEARKLAGLRTKRETVDAALREFVARRRQQRTLDLVGLDLIDPAYDVRAVRAAMADGPC